jgi:hypothetical protein
LKARVAEPLQDRLPNVVNQVRELKERLEQASAVADAAAVEIGRVREPAAPGIQAQVFNDAEIDAAFAEPTRLEAMDIHARDSVRGLIDSRRITAEGFAHRVWDAAMHAVRAVAPEYLKRLSIPAEEIARRMDRLAPLAVFTSDWTSLPESSDVEKLWLIGLPESMADQTEAVLSKLAPESRAATDVVVHSDEERVVMTVQDHGFPLYSLAEVQECRRAFEASDAATRALRFVLPEESARAWDVLPLDPSASRQFFALAMALGRVRRVGQDYVYNPGDARSVDIPLASAADRAAARQAARDAFLAAGYSSQIKSALEGRMRQEGNEELYTELGAWLAQEESRAADADYPAEFQREIEAVREYQQSIR